MTYTQHQVQLKEQAEKALRQQCLELPKEEAEVNEQAQQM